jgi:hypothetical protein
VCLLSCSPHAVCAMAPSLQEEEKQRIALSPTSHYRGWQRLGSNVTQGKRDLHEGIDLYKVGTAVPQYRFSVQYRGHHDLRLTKASEDWICDPARQLCLLFRCASGMSPVVAVGMLFCPSIAGVDAWLLVTTSTLRLLMACRRWMLESWQQPGCPPAPSTGATPGPRCVAAGACCSSNEHFRLCCCQIGCGMP